MLKSLPDNLENLTVGRLKELLKLRDERRFSTKKYLS
jgi:hypothetical protein